MRIVSRSAHNQIRYLSNASLEALYAKLQAVLPDQHLLDFFAKPERRANETLWYDERPGTPIPFDQLSDSEKDSAADLLESCKTKILQQVSADSDLLALGQTLFNIPSPDYIHVNRNPDGTLSVALSQWACASKGFGSNTDPFSTYINRPRSNRSLVSLRVTYADGGPASGKIFGFSYQDVRRAVTADTDGFCSMGPMKNGADFAVYEQHPKGQQHIQRFQVNPDTEVYDVVFPFYTDAAIKVLDESQTPVPNYPLRLAHSGGEHNAQSDESGMILLSDLTSGDILTITQAELPTNRLSEKLRREDNNFIFQIIEPKEEPISEQVPDPEPLALVEPSFDVNIQVIGHTNAPIPDATLRLTTSRNNLERRTDEEGIARFNSTDFSDLEKINTSITLGGKKNSNPWKKSFTYKKEQNLYILKLKRFNWWWLLLLLPLLLFVQCEKDINVKTTKGTDKKPLAGCTVHFSYCQAFLYRNGRFFVHETAAFDQIANTDGIARFERLPYSIYSWIFLNLSGVETFARTDCFASDTLNPCFHYVFDEDTLRLHLVPMLGSAQDFKVVDDHTGQPIANARVLIGSEIGGNMEYDSVRTDANGVVLAAKIPVCASHIIARGDAAGYAPDSLSYAGYKDIVGAVDKKRTLRLKPGQLELEFRTIDPGPDTLVNNTDLIVTVDGKRSDPKSSGNGAFKVKAYASSLISIEADKPGYIRNDSRVRNRKFNDLLAAAQEERDIPMQPRLCNTSTAGNSGKSYYLDQYYMGKSAGRFKFSYFTDTQPDEINIYCNKNRIFHYFAATNKSTLTEMVHYNSSSIIQVEVIGASNWRYQVDCPE